MSRKFLIKKRRNLDEILEDSFKFFKENVKSILKVIWEQNKIIIAGLVISYFFYNYHYFGMFNSLISFKNKNIETLSPEIYTPQFILTGFVLVIFILIFTPRFMTAVAGFLRYYDTETGKVDIKAVKELVNRKFWGLVGLTFLISFMIVGIVILFSILMVVLSSLKAAGIFLLLAIFIPLILYAVVYLTMVYYVYILEDVSVFEAMSRARYYLRERFWFSLGVIVVMGIILWLINMVLNAPVMIFVMMKTIFMMQENNPAVSGGQGSDILMGILAVLSYIGQLIFRIIYILAMGFLFYSLKEYHTHSGLLEKIDEIGKEDEVS